MNDTGSSFATSVEEFKTSVFAISTSFLLHSSGFLLIAAITSESFVASFVTASNRFSIRSVTCFSAGHGWF